MVTANVLVPNPGFLMKKIPTWKLTVKDWDNDEFKTQVSLLFDELNEVVFFDYYNFLAIRLASRKARIRWRTSLPCLQE